MGLPDVSICTPWAEAEDVPEGSSCAGLDGLEEWLVVASDLLYDLSGRQFPGICSDSFRPVCPCRLTPRQLDEFSFGACCASQVSEIDLGVWPLASVLEVKVDGEVLDESLYRVDDYKTVVRLRDADGRPARWPCSQNLDLPDTDVGTWSVTVSYGTMPPPAGKKAALALACELATASSDSSDCRLPERVTSIVRQGVSIAVLDPFDFLEDGKTGLYEVDLFLKAANPGGLRRAPSVTTPSTLARRPRRVGT